MLTAIERANAEQRRAANPAVSAFTAASAGSGKTKLLTDRLLRLMLDGARPDKILCLTYTKAAAAEMRIRLNARLGAWVVLPAPALAAQLQALDVTPDAATLARARKLFADVLDLAGGMRIETIHAFCQSLLRRFPLEAELSPHFQLADDENFAQTLREARETALAAPGARAAAEILAAEIDETSFIQLTEAFCASPAATSLLADAQALVALQRAALGAGADDEATMIAAAVNLPHESELKTAILRIAFCGTAIKGQGQAQQWLNWLAQTQPLRIKNWQRWAGFFFTSKGEPSDIASLCGKQLNDEAAAIAAVIARERARISAVQEACKAARLVALNAALIDLLQPIARAEQQAKTLAARLSYGDLITQTQKLLHDPGASWVLYKLDGGITHLLLDEVQDTSPAQWEIANAIAAEFFAGSGAHDEPRSIFAVGDPKQSIFSFQGADKNSFESYREKFKDQAVAAGQPWLDGALTVSFRSTLPVLALTDAVFADGFARSGVYAQTEVAAHVPSRTGQAGRVELWPLTQAQPATPAPAWAVPGGYQRAASAHSQLAAQIADAVAARLEQPLPSRGRRARPGDVLILVRRRNALVGAIMRALKANGIPVAGLDRMVLTAQPAISDMLALCDALLLPEDDCAMAQFLVSPLGGLADESLMALAMGRSATLVAALFARAAEQPDWAEAKGFYEALRQKVDFLTPHALLAEALGPLGGRAKLLRRLGAEAAEPLDEFLAEALNFSQIEPGSLQGFVQKMRLASASLKRETEQGGDQVRIMTVHGAKGLQAPIVILPDTTGLPQANDQLFWLEVPGQAATVPLYCPHVGLRSQAVTAAVNAKKAADLYEYNRLLYVALTRAEDELLICGVQGKKKLPEKCWYNSVAAGFARLDADKQNDRLVFATLQTDLPDRHESDFAPTHAVLPAWAGGAPAWAAHAPPRETTRPERIVPSRAAEDEVKRAIAASPLGAGPLGAGPLGAGLAQTRSARLAAMAKGSVIHALLQHLPSLPASSRRAAARQFLEAQDETIAAQAEGICESVLAVLNNPVLYDLFGPNSHAEIPLAGIVGEREIGGLIDRLAILPGQIWVADYKTDRTPPASLDAVPEKYVAQLAAYRAILRQIYPDHALRCLLIWTETGAVIELPDDLLAAQVLA